MAQVIQFANHFPSDQIKTVHIIPENQINSPYGQNVHIIPERKTHQISSPSGQIKTVHTPPENQIKSPSGQNKTVHMKYINIRKPTPESITDCFHHHIGAQAGKL